MRILIALLLLAASLSAQITLENMTVYPSYGTAWFTHKINGGSGQQPSYWVEYGPTTSLGFTSPVRSTWPLYLPISDQVINLPIGALQQDTVYYFRIVLDGATQWNCSTAVGGVTSPVPGAQVGCDVGSGLGWFRTTTLPAGYNTGADTAVPDVSSLPTAPPTPTLAPINVPAGDATAFAAALTTCAGNTGASGVQEIVLQAGTTVKGKFDLPAKTGAGTCIIRSSGTLPANGTRITMADVAQTATIELPITWSGQADFWGAINAHYNTPTQGWYFLGIRFKPEAPVSASNPVEYTITSVSDDGTVIRVSPAHNYDFKGYTMIQVYGVQGTWSSAKGPNGTFMASTPNGADGINIVRSTTLVCDSPPCYTTGGKVRYSVAQNICGATNAAEIVVTTCSEHGYVDNDAVPISPHPANFINIPSWAGYEASTNQYRVVVEGSSVAANNGVYTLNGGRNPTIDGTTDTITLANHGYQNGDRVGFFVPKGEYYPDPYQGPYYVINATQNTFQISDTQGGPPRNCNSDTNPALRVYFYATETKFELSGTGLQACAADCGTIRLLVTHHIKGVQGNTAANGSHFIKVLSPTTVKLIGVAGNGAYASGGLMTGEPVHWVSLFSIGHTSDRVHLDRCIFDLGWPTRISAALTHSAGHSSIINNYFNDAQFFRHIVPGLNSRRFTGDGWGIGGHPYYIATSDAIDTTHGDTKLIQNNFLEAHGITVFSQDPDPGAPEFKNSVIRRNHFYLSDAKRANSPTSDGLYYGHRHHLEWKRGTRMLIDGNRFTGGWIDWNACGPTITISPRNSNSLRDFTFTNNIIEDGTTSIYWNSIDDRPTSITDPISNVRFENNVIWNMDGTKRSYPWDDAVNPSNCAYGLYARFGMESVHVTHNYFGRAKGARTGTFGFFDGRGSGLTIKNNILWYTNDENWGPLWPANQVSTASGLPAPTGNQKQAMDNLYSHSVFSHNVVIPGPRSSADPNHMDSTSGTYTLFKQDCTNYFTDFSSVTCVGAVGNNDSANQRLASMQFVDAAAGNFRLAEASPYNSTTLYTDDGKLPGPDWDALEAAQGGIDPAPSISLSATPETTTGGSSTLAWTAAYALACSINQGIGVVSESGGSLAVTPSNTTTYTLTCSGLGGTSTAQATVTVVGTPTATLSASSTSVLRNTSVTLTWSSTNATSCSISGIGAVACLGSQVVAVSGNTTFTLTANGAGGEATAATTITVTGLPKRKGHSGRVWESGRTW